MFGNSHFDLKGTLDSFASIGSEPPGPVTATGDFLLIVILGGIFHDENLRVEDGGQQNGFLRVYI